MDAQIEEVDSCNKRVRLTIPHEVYREKVNRYLDQLAHQIKMPGFRAGKIPRSVVEKKLGSETKREVLTQLISESLSQVLEEKNIRAAGMPSLLEVNGEEGTDIDVSASVEVFPDFTVKDVSVLEVPFSRKPISDEEVDKVVQFFRSRAAKLKPISDRGVQDQDIVKIDFKGTIDGQPFEGNEGQDKVLLVGGKVFLEDFERKLIGMHIGETRSFMVNMPIDYAKTDIAGQEVAFEVTLKGLQERKLPYLDDEFAKIANPDKPFASVEDMRSRIRLDLEEESRKEGRKVAKQNLAKMLTEENPIDVPENLVKNQIKHMSQQGKQKDHVHGPECNHDHEENSAIAPEEDLQYREAAVKMIQQELIILNLAESLKIEITEEEVDREATEFLQTMGEKNPAKLRKQWQRDGTLDRIRSRMIRDRTLEKLLDQVKVKEEMVDS